MLALGIGYTLFKFPALHNQNRFASTFWSNLVSSVIVGVIILFFSPSSLTLITTNVVWFSLLWGLVFSLNMFFYISALKEMYANVLFPIASAISTVFVVGVGFLFLSDTVSFMKLAGIMVILAFVYLLNKKGGKIVLNKNLSFYFLGIVITSFFVKYFQKVLIDLSGDPIAVMLPEYISASLFAFIFGYIFYKKNFMTALIKKQEIKSGTIIAVPLFVGAYFLVSALNIGELSQVFAIHPVYVVVVTLLTSLFFKEKLGFKKLLIILGIVVGIILIKIG
ncbi:EamA family transporter [Patescibacteria group bacterium]|nr:EamA family transporter [Patescibacteria group bacterium]